MLVRVVDVVDVVDVVVIVDMVDVVDVVAIVYVVDVADVVDVMGRGVSDGMSTSSGMVFATRFGYCSRMICSCCWMRLSLSFRRVLLTVPEPGPLRRTRLRRGMLWSCGISRSSSGGARSMAAKRDWSQITNVSIRTHERRN